MTVCSNKVRCRATGIHTIRKQVMYRISLSVSRIFRRFNDLCCVQLIIFNDSSGYAISCKCFICVLLVSVSYILVMTLTY